MQNAHLRLGLLEYHKATEKTRHESACRLTGTLAKTARRIC